MSRMGNKLAGEKSPYLLQHADNPVHWEPWGEEAFARARRENKPIFLSIGYSTCHWCHVMAHESFENPAIAEIMNREFVNIKMDREERPDIDRVYMTFVQATTGHGGWPMSVWLTPELKPFVGGTYFPPEERHGQPGFPKVLQRVAHAWKENGARIAEQGDRIIEALRESAASVEDANGPVGATAAQAGYEQFARSFDAQEGGFGSAPKFPRPVTLNFLLRYHLRHQNDSSGKQALDMVLFTLRKMAAGGMHDHLGGGFHRYSVDAFWHVPHFEKMLYDQAQLASAYLDAFQLTRQPLFENVARDTLDYVRRDLTAPDGGFYSAEDADSEVNGGGVSNPAAGLQTRPPKAEGAFYVWTKQEIESALGSDAEIFNYHYGVEADGNAPAGTDPHGEFTGKNILLKRHTLGQTGQHFGKTEAEIAEKLEAAREKLLAVRSGRPRPHLDDKIITAWNGLMISAFARGAQVLGDPDYLHSATRAADFIRQNLYSPATGRLIRNFRDGASKTEGFAEDYAFLIQGLLDLYEASFEIGWLQWALKLQETQDNLFFDEKNGGYFTTTGQDASVLLRMKEDHDSAEPAPSSVAARNLWRLAQIRSDDALRARAEKTMGAFAGVLTRIPSAMPEMLAAALPAEGKPRQIVLAGEREAEETTELAAEVHRHFLPEKVLLLADGAEGQKFLEEKLPALREMRKIEGKATAYVCENFACQVPVTDSGKLRALLS